MRIVITGNMGYVGPILARHLRDVCPEAELIGFDAAYFAHCLTGASALPELILNQQHFGDIRDFPAELLTDVDAVVNSAAISNDPMGNKYEQVTEEINFKAGIRLAEMAAQKGVKNFVFASSCSVYGTASRGARREEDELSPLTAYARSKVVTEKMLATLDRRDMTVTCLRFATACGISERLRLDLVLNDFVASALTSGEIMVLSDGTPWRPLIDVRDMARAIEWATNRKPNSGGAFLTVNVGSDQCNYQVKHLAEAVARAVPGTKIKINLASLPDKRSYRVDFSRYHELAPRHVPRVTLDQSIIMLRDGLSGMGFDDRNFRNSDWIRLKVLEDHIAAGRLLASLRWRNGFSGGEES